MLFDWFTVISQVVNFIILVWLLKRFLYKPILHAIEERERLIATELADAEKKQVAAQKVLVDFQQKSQEIDKQRSAILRKAKDEAKTEGQRLLYEAGAAADALSARRQETFRDDLHNLDQAISRRIRQEVFAIARKALRDLATASLEDRMGEVFTRRLQEMDGNLKADLLKAFEASTAQAMVRSAFDLSAKQREAIQHAINEIFSSEIQIRFETDPDLIGGIELSTNGLKIAWSIDDYLTSLEKGLDELLKEQAKTEEKVETKQKNLSKKPGLNINGI